MKKLFFVYIVAALMFFVSQAHAQDIAIAVGLRSDSADAEVASVKVNSKSNWQLGGIAFFDVNGPWKARTGFMYSNRIYDVNTGNATTSGDYRMTYFDVPAGMMYKFSDYGGAFAGAVLALNVSKSCPGATCSGVKSSPVGFQLGTSLKFAPQMGVDLYFESISGNLMDGIQNSKAVCADFLFMFD